MAGTVIKQARDTLGAQVQRDDHRGTKSKWGDCLQAEGGVSEGASPAGTLTVDFQPPNHEKKTSVKSPSLWYFVLEPLAN